jgi:hypothetical protein
LADVNGLGDEKASTSEQDVRTIVRWRYSRRSLYHRGISEDKRFLMLTLSGTNLSSSQEHFGTARDALKPPWILVARQAVVQILIAARCLMEKNQGHSGDRDE